MTAPSSLRLSLTVKSNDHFPLIFSAIDSVIFSTGGHKFDINVFRQKKRRSDNKGREKLHRKLPNEQEHECCAVA